jgi:glycosyltransferase involved in cell wall biosynthesis
MKLMFYMPFKPPDHVNPSGDLITGRELRDSLLAAGHSVNIASDLRSRWIYWKPGALLRLQKERRRIRTTLKASPSDLWFTYHSYYKAPDMLGPHCSMQGRIPYVIFQGIYSTKRRRSLATLPGFLLNRKALLTARLVYTNKRSDERNLARLLPRERLCYIAPGIHPEEFDFDGTARAELRNRWQVGDRVVIFTAAMLRPGVKTRGVKQVLASCATLKRAGRDLFLVVAGDGHSRTELEAQARQDLGPDHLFLGKIPRHDLHRYYSAADLFAFPGIQESLGMVYLEAQAAGLPVVAFADWGAAEAVIDRRTGLLSPADQPDRFTASIGALLENRDMRRKLGAEARRHIRENHDISENYRLMIASLERIARP